MKNILKTPASILFAVTFILMVVPSFDNEIEKDKVGFGLLVTLLLSLVLFNRFFFTKKTRNNWF